MRENKFRGKRLDNREWVYGWLIRGLDYACIINGVSITKKPGITERELQLEKYAEVDPKTVEQYTGLKDKNGKEIYEGDILLNDKDAECMPGDSFVVKYLPGHFVAGGILGAGDHIGEDCKVIGNITENPELLEGGD